MFNVCPLLLCPGNGTASTGPRSSIFPTARANLAPNNTPLAIKFWAGRTVANVELRNQEEASQDHSRPFCNWSFRESNQRLPTSKVEEITKYSPRKTHCKLWFTFWLGNRKCASSPTSKLSAKATLPYTFITGYAITPPQNSDQNTINLILF